MPETNQEEFREFQYFYHLNDSLLFDKLLISHYPGIRSIRNELWTKLEPRFRKNKSQKKEVLGVILCNLKEGLLNLKTVAVSRNINDYYPGKGDKPRYYRLHLNYYDMTRVMDGLKDEGLIHSADGYPEGDNSPGKTTRIWASKKLASMLLENINGKTKVSPCPANNKLVELKNWNNKKTLSFEETDFTRKREQDIEEYHDFMANVKVSCLTSETYPAIFKAVQRICQYLPCRLQVIPSDQVLYSDYINELTSILYQISYETMTIPLPDYTLPVTPVIYVVSHLLRGIACEKPISPRLKSVFNKADFMRGGRLYSGKDGWQNLSKQDRKNIIFDGKPSVEADFKGMHLSMLYARVGLQAPHDPYAIALREGESDAMREIIKRMTLISINTKNDTETVNVMKKLEANLRKQKNAEGWLEYKYHQMLELLSANNSCLNEKDEFWWELLARIKEVHAPISKYFCSDVGGELMYRDSQIIMDACLSLVRQEIPCLPVHDSIIAPAEHKETLCAVMENAFCKYTGGHCAIEIK
jgi:hypothetical protein